MFPGIYLKFSPWNIILAHQLSLWNWSWKTSLENVSFAEETWCGHTKCSPSANNIGIEKNRVFLGQVTSPAYILSVIMSLGTNFFFPVQVSFFMELPLSMWPTTLQSINSSNFCSSMTSSDDSVLFYTILRGGHTLLQLTFDQSTAMLCGMDKLINCKERLIFTLFTLSVCGTCNQTR